MEVDHFNINISWKIRQFAGGVRDVLKKLGEILGIQILDPDESPVFHAWLTFCPGP